MGSGKRFWRGCRKMIKQILNHGGCSRFLLFLLVAFFLNNFHTFAEDPTQQFEGFNLSGYTKSGDKSWDVKGDTAVFMGTMISMTNIVAHAYGEQKMNLTAKTGTVDQKSGDMHLEKDVVITSDTGATLTTDSLDWKRERDLVTTRDQVVLIDEKFTATGMGAKAHPNLKTAQMNEDVTVEVTPDPKKTNEKAITITCDGPMEIDQSKQQAIFNKNVVAQQEGVRQLKADRMELYFDPLTKQVKELVCVGNVAISMGGNTTYSQKAIYRASDQKLVLSGQPKLILITEGEDGLAAIGNKESR